VAFQPTAGTDEADPCLRRRRSDGGGDGETGVDVTAGAGRGDHHAGRRRRSTHRALLRRVIRPSRPRQSVTVRRRDRPDASRPTAPSTPSANIVNTSDDPPKDTNGSGTPVTGIRPTTAHMLMRACPTIHAVKP